MNSSERREKVYALREEGMTFREIGLRFGFTVERARQLYLREKRERQLRERHDFASRISARSRNALIRHFADENIVYDTGRVVKLGLKRLAKVRGLGRQSIAEISVALYDLGHIDDIGSW